MRDPRIGREILIGSALGGVLLILDVLRNLGPYLIGLPPGIPNSGGDVAALSSAGNLILSWADRFSAIACFGFYASRVGQPLFGKFD